MNTTRRGFLGGLLALAAVPMAKKAPETFTVTWVRQADGTWAQLPGPSLPLPLQRTVQRIDHHAPFGGEAPYLADIDAAAQRWVNYRDLVKYYGGVQWPQ